MQYTLKYEIKSETTCKVVGFEGEPTEVNIPEEVEIEGKNYSITKFGTDCFELSLVFKGSVLWKTMLKTLEFEGRADELKAIAANYKQLYDEVCNKA